ncbi:MAG TPA: sensor domain-containing diguanylate cyclase, partial [Kineosporiaceae bacterium]|nr:sensor domain-containing diguanylate cyclase [Kineosporiaceae bacterium]
MTGQEGGAALAGDTNEVTGLPGGGRLCERTLSAALGASGDGFAVYRVERGDPESVARFTLEVVNPAGARWFGADPAAPGHSVPAGSGAVMLDAGLKTMMAAVVAGAGPTRQRLEREAGPDGGAAVLEAVITRLGQDRVVLAGRDVTELASGQRLLAAAYEQTAEVRATLQTALDATSEAFAVYDVVRDQDSGVSGLRLVLINAAGALQLGAEDPEDLTGGDLRDFFPDAEACGMWQAVDAALDAQVTRTFRRQEHDPDGQWTAAWDNTIAPVGEERVVITWREVSHDERRERQLEQAHDQAHHAATHDALTGLANRVLLQDALTAAMRSSDEQERVGLVYVDLDHFKDVNDTWGHSVGDALLQAVAGRLTQVVRGGDIAARLGGDEFVLLLRGLPPDWDASGFLARCRSVVEQPVMLPSGVINPQASFGLVTSSPA